MIVTTYTCDKCGHEQIGSDQMWNIGISVTVYSRTPQYSHSREPLKGELWCRPCVVKLGLLPTSEAVNDPPQPDPVPTFEEMIREIIKEEIDESR